MNKEEIEIIEKEINNLNIASQCSLLSGIERKDWIILANAMKKMLKENKQLKEIIEEPKKIEKFDKDKMFIDDNYGYSMNWEYLENKLNEIIDYINKGE